MIRDRSDDGGTISGSFTKLLFLCVTVCLLVFLGMEAPAALTQGFGHEWFGMVGFVCGIVVTLVLTLRIRATYAEAEKQARRDRKRIRVFVGDVGLNPFAAQKGVSPECDDGLDGRQNAVLAALDQTGLFRDALLLYASKYWVQQSDGRAPSKHMGLHLINFGTQESTGEDGKTISHPNLQPLFLPLDSAFSRTLAGSSGSSEDPQPACASLSDGRDVVLAIVPREKSQKGGPKKKKGDKEAGPAELEAVIYLDIYGQDAFQKVQALVGEVMEHFNSEIAHRLAATGPEPEAKPLFWYTLAQWGEVNPKDHRTAAGLRLPVPIFHKKPILGSVHDRKNYVQSFFLAHRDKLLGQPHSLIDQFQDKTGNFAVPGVQRKLNLLCHGPPGTGKSKLVRTLAMYLQRSVVAFTLGQIATEVQLITLLDNLKCITDDPKNPALDLSYEDLLFVIEEIDTDPRRICLQREEEPQPVPAVEEEPEEPKQQRSSKKGPEPGRKPAEPPLSLGGLLRQLDGGSSSPGRLIVMTTNREGMLDAAFKRPGRVKKVRMDNLAYPEFKQMVLHFRRTQGSIACSELWTRAVDELAQAVMADFQALQAARSGDLDRRGLGLSPALLEEQCLESHTLQDLFGALVEELQAQSLRLGAELQLASPGLMAGWNWRVHTIWVATMRCLSGTKLSEALKAWPEQTLRPSQEPSQAGAVVQQLLQDEDALNSSLEFCRVDYSHMSKFAELKYRVQVELTPALDELHALASEDTSLKDVFGQLVAELQSRWLVARGTNDHEILAHLPEEPHVLTLLNQLRIS